MKAQPAITVVVENTPQRADLLGEHGLSVWIQTPAGAVLFDTGQGPALPVNARALGILLAQANMIVLSHGHYDHSGGLPFALEQAPRAQLFAHRAVTLPRYSLKPGVPPKFIGMGPQAVLALSGATARTQWINQPCQILDRVWLTGPIPRETDFEDVRGPFFLDAQGHTPDPISDDQALWLDTDRGLIVMAGCAHAGIINTLAYIHRLTGGRRIHGVAGGFHLLHADAKRLARTLDALQRDFHPDWLLPLHCTGEPATAALRAAFPEPPPIRWLTCARECL